MMQRRVSRAKYNEAITTALRERRLRLDAEDKLNEKTARETAADRQTADTITRLAQENAALRAILATHVVALDGDGQGEEADSLRRQLANHNVDISGEIAARTLPGVRPAVRRFTRAEARLIGELHRTRKALGAMEDQCLEVQRVNEVQARQLREAAREVAS